MKLIIQAILLSFILFAAYSVKAAEPEISIYQGTEKNTEVLVLEWPDGTKDKLVYKTTDIKSGSDAYINWFNDMYNKHEEKK